MNGKVQNVRLQLNHDKEEKVLIMAEYKIGKKTHHEVISNEEWHFKDVVKDLKVKVFNFNMNPLSMKLKMTADYFKEMGYLLEKEAEDDTWIILSLFGSLAIIGVSWKFYLKFNRFWWNDFNKLDKIIETGGDIEEDED